VEAFSDTLAAGRNMKLRKPDILSNDVAFLQYTGGTTGISKGATLLHRHIIANVLQFDAWLRPAWRKPLAVDQLFVVCALSLYHIFALAACFLVSMRAGGVSLLIPNPRDLAGLIGELTKNKVNLFPAVSTLYNMLLHTDGFDKVDFSMLKMCISAGMPTPTALANAWLKFTGCALSEAYGLSDASPALTCDPSDTSVFTNSIGVPLPSTFISIRNDHGDELPFGEPGEICAKGPQVMAGYWNRPEETAAVMTSDGYFRTGDISVMNSDGSIEIVDRKKDMIVVSGFNVFPNEIDFLPLAPSRNTAFISPTAKDIEF
jgi:long-chain acyl-CoA synthetase